MGLCLLFLCSFSGGVILSCHYHEFFDVIVQFQSIDLFGLGMNESPFLRMFRCVLVMVGSVASNTISLSLFVFTLDLYGSIKDSLK